MHPDPRSPIDVAGIGSGMKPDPMTGHPDIEEGAPMRLLLVEDGRIDAKMALLFLINDAPGEFAVRHVASLQAAGEALRARPFDLVITDLDLPDSQGAETVTRLREQAGDVPVIVLSGVPDAGTAIAAFKAGAREVLLKSQLAAGVLVNAARQIRWSRLQGAALDEARRRNAELLELHVALLEQMPMGCVLLAPDGRVTHMNRGASRFFGVASPVPGDTRFPDLVPADQGGSLSQDMAALVAGSAEAPIVGIAPTLAGNGRMLDCEWRMSSLHARDGRLLALLGVFREVGDEVRAMERRAATDALTGLPGRRVLEGELQSSLSIGDPFAIFFIDLDGFKQVNDRMGHATGDTVLAAMARRLSTTMRPGDLAVRFGGDEFVILARQVRSDTDADAIRRRLEQAAREAGEGLGVGATVGIALYPRDGTDPAALLAQADRDMYRRKPPGRRGAA